MKKTVKSLIIAASVAAIAGIGAVSFAAWSGGVTEKDYNNAGNITGHLDTTGFGSDTTANSALGTLVPWNQGAEGTNTKNIADTVKQYDITLDVTGNDVANYKIVGYYTAQKGSTPADYTWADDSKLVYTIDTTPNTAYDGTGWTDWTAQKDSDKVDGAYVNGDMYTSELNVGKYYVHIALVSSDDADMDVTLAFHFELVEKA